MTSTIKVNNIQNQCGANIINENSDTITIGASGDTIALASGASQTGFGREGSVDWQTSIQTSASFTAVNGQGFFIDTSSNAITANLPAGTAGSIVAFADYARNFATNNLTISPNGSQKIGGANGNTVLNVNGQASTFVYADDTKGWINVQNAEDTEVGTAFVQATGGTVTTVCTDFKVHTFTGPGTFCVSAGQGPRAIVDYMVIAGGGGGGAAKENRGGGGGGAGGWRASSGTSSGCYTAGPGPLTSPVSGIPVTVQGYSIVVGGGGAGASSPPSQSVQGSTSSGLGISSAGGGQGQNSYCNPSLGAAAGSGGSGGGAGAGGTVAAGKGSGNTPPVTPPQGFDGGPSCSPGQTGPNRGGHGGGGAGGLGQDSQGPPSQGAKGGVGVTSCITASPVGYAGGAGAGSGNPDCGGAGGGAPSPTSPAFGGGRGGGGPGSAAPTSRNGYDGSTNTGGGGGGANGYTPGASPASGGSGGSGIVIIRYKFQ